MHYSTPIANMPRYTKGQVPTCPHCDVLLEDPIEDFVPPRSANWHEGDCGSCDGLFEVRQVSDDTFELEELEGKA